MQILVIQKLIYEFTAQEIIDDFPNGLDMIVAGVGTSRTITGITAKRLRKIS